MDSLGDKYLWRPNGVGPIFFRWTFKLPGQDKPRQFVKSLGTTSYPEARRARDRIFKPAILALRRARTSHEFVQFVIHAAEDVMDRDLSLAAERLGVLPVPEPTLMTDGAVALAAPEHRGDEPDVVDLTWGELSAMYLDDVQRRKAVTTYKRYRLQVTLMDEFFGRATRISSISRRKVGQFLEYLDNLDRYAEVTINVVMGKVSTIFKFGQRRGLVETNPAEGIRIDGAQYEEGQPFTREEADAVCVHKTQGSKHYPEELFRVFSIVSRYTGARLGEIAVLTAEDVLEKEGVRCLRFETLKTRSRKGKTLNRREERFVPVAPKLDATIDDCLAKRPTGSLFPRRGDYQDQRAHHFSKNYNRIVKKLAPDKCFKSWRHYAISEMLNAEVPREIRLQIVGHKESAVHAVYSHAYVQSMLKAVSKIH